MADSIKWNGHQVLQQLKTLAGKRVDAAARVLANGIKKSVSRGQPIRGKGARRRGLQPSQPGEYPKMVTTHLRRNIVSESDASTVSARVGTNLKYGKYLQLGTSKMDARPWLSLGVQDNAATMKRVIETGTVGEVGGGKGE